MVIPAFADDRVTQEDAQQLGTVCGVDPPGCTRRSPLCNLPCLVHLSKVCGMLQNRGHTLIITTTHLIASCRVFIKENRRCARVNSPPSEVRLVKATDTWPALDQKRNQRVGNLAISEMISQKKKKSRQSMCARSESNLSRLQ